MDEPQSGKFFILCMIRPVDILASSYTCDAFERMIERETGTVELKTGVSKLQEPIVAFSNGVGGVIIIGVDDHRRVLGRRLDQGTEDKIHEAALAAHRPGRYFIRQIDVAGTPVVAVEVHRREEGFAQTSDGRILIRQGARNVALIGDDAWQLISSRTLKRFERSDSGVKIDAADHDALEELRSVHEWTSDPESLHCRLAERGLATNGNLTIAGALLLTDTRESLALNKAVVDVRRYSDEGPDYNRRELFGGPLQQQIRNATDFVIKELGSDLIVAGVHRYDLPKLPVVVVREAIANAVAHRNYEINRTAIIIQLRANEVVITSPGSLPEPVTVETIREAQAARNPDTIATLRKFRLAEDAGRGVDVMEDEMEQALLDPPLFSDGGNFVEVRLSLNGPITPRERGWLAELESDGRIESYDKLLLVHAARGFELTNATARSILKTNDSGHARRALQRLRDARMLQQHGDRGGAVYTLNPSISPPVSYRLNIRQLSELVLRAAKNEDLTNERVREITGLERLQALQLLRNLVREKQLRQVGFRRGTRYILPE
ncbi:MAG: ATP-binding protein [Pseudonocardiaceae bacterium]